MDQEIPDPTPNSNGKTGQVNYKNSLQQHAQRSAVGLPVYWTVNHGPPHAPRFKSSVTVDGETFSSTNVFSNRKEAEQDVSRVALDGIAENLKTKGVPLLRNEVKPMQLWILHGCLLSRLGCLIKSVLGKNSKISPNGYGKGYTVGSKELVFQDNCIPSGTDRLFSRIRWIHLKLQDVSLKILIHIHWGKLGLQNMVETLGTSGRFITNFDTYPLGRLIERKTLRFRAQSILLDAPLKNAINIILFVSWLQIESTVLARFSINNPFLTDNKFMICDLYHTVIYIYSESSQYAFLAVSYMCHIG